MSNRNGQHLPAATQEPQPVPAKELTLRTLLGYTDGQLRVTDPLVMNLLIAKEIPALAHLDISAYVRKADSWATEIKKGLRDAEREFHQTPDHWKNDLAFFRLGYLCYFVDEKLGIRYREDQQAIQVAFYTDPNDLFLNGVMDGRKGTCANMAALHVALGWRLRWTVSLACVWSHLICRYDDGKVRHNIEATKTGGGGFHSHPDEYYLKAHNLPQKAIDCGSDLRALQPREMLGEFIGLRGRYYQDTQQFQLSEADYLLARALFPKSRFLHYAQVMTSLQTAGNMFERNELGHPAEVASWLWEVTQTRPPEVQTYKSEKESADGSLVAGEYSYNQFGRVSAEPQVEEWIVRLFGDRKPLGFEAGDANLYRYVKNNPTNATDPSGLQALPAGSRGTWIEGTPGNGVFQYHETPQNRQAGLANVQVRFSNNSIAPGGFPASWYYGGNAANATVTIEAVRGTQADMTAATAQMRSRLNNPNWNPPEGFTWNHAGPPGSRTMELVNGQLHGAVHHQGGAALARAALRPVARGVGALSVYLTIRDACQMAGVLPPDEFVINAPYYFTASDGSVYFVQTPSTASSVLRGIGSFVTFGYVEAASAQMVFVAGPREGQSLNITSAEVTLHQLRGEELYGRLVGGGLFDGARRFIPGSLRQTFPVTEIDPITRNIRYVGYYDETGYHAFPNNPIPGSIEWYQMNGA